MYNLLKFIPANPQAFEYECKSKGTLRNDLLYLFCERDLREASKDALLSCTYSFRSSILGPQFWDFFFSVEFFMVTRNEVFFPQEK